MLVTNPSEYQLEDGSVPFSLDEKWLATMIKEKRNGDVDEYSFAIDNFIKHANAKGYNRHVATGAMKPSELLSVGQEALGLFLLENYREPWEQLVEHMTQGENAIPKDVPLKKAKYSNPGNKKRPWKNKGMERYNQLHEEVRRDRLSSEGQRFEIEFKREMQEQAGEVRNKKRKATQSVGVAAAHELDDVSSDDEDTSYRSRRTATTVTSSLSSRGSNNTSSRAEV